MASDLYIEDGEVVFRWYGTDPKIIYAIYNFSFLFFVYFLPLACIVCGFLAILSALKRKSDRLSTQPSSDNLISQTEQEQN